MISELLASVIFFILLGYTASYCPYKSSQGYIALPTGDNTYRIEYYSKGKKAAEEDWSS